MYRSKWWNVAGRREERKQKAQWYEKDGSEATFFVNATPNGELAEECKNIFKKAGIKVKVIEKNGKNDERNAGKIRSVQGSEMQQSQL